MLIFHRSARGMTSIGVVATRPARLTVMIDEPTAVPRTETLEGPPISGDLTNAITPELLLHSKPVPDPLVEATKRTVSPSSTYCCALGLRLNASGSQALQLRPKQQYEAVALVASQATGNAHRRVTSAMRAERCFMVPL